MAQQNDRSYAETQTSALNPELQGRRLEVRVLRIPGPLPGGRVLYAAAAVRLMYPLRGYTVGAA